MKLSELKAIVDRETERMKKHRQDPEVVIVDMRYGQHGHQSPIPEEIRPVAQEGAFIAEGSSIDANCANLWFDDSNGWTLYANRAYFVLTGDDPVDFM